MKCALQQGLEQLGLALDDGQEQQLLDYLALIGKWNRVYNLTAVRDPAEMLASHLFDSLAAVPPLQRHIKQCGNQHGSKTLLDVGSGAGLPGVVFAICNPDLQVSCVDTVGKKAAFIQQAAAALSLPNLQGLHHRVEKLQQRYDIVCSRAFASLPDFVNWSANALAANGIWLAMKGKKPDDEIAKLPPWAEVFHVEQLAVPMLDAQRCIVWMRNNAGC